MRMRAIAFVILASLVAAVPAAAQDARLEAARKEGKVVWYTSLALTSAEKVARLFETRYPGIKVEVHRTGSQRILQRVMQELRANIKNVDVIHTSDAGHYVLLKDKKLLLRYTPAGADRFPPGFKDRDGYYYGLRATVNVPPLSHLLGWDYFRALGQQSVMIVQSAVDPAGVVASGERPVAVDGGDYTFYQSKKAGNPVEIVYPKEGVPLVVSPTAIAAFAPRPNAAKLFTDYTFTKEVQQVLADTEGLYTGHPEVTYPADKPKLGELKLLTADPEELEKRSEEIKRRFVEFFGA
jgi:iron(III) transport system substrate-binding protein